MNINKIRYTSIAITTLILASTGTIFAKPGAMDREVQQAFESAYANECDGFLAGDQGKITPEIFKLQFRHDYKDAPLSTYMLYIFPCYVGAYNQSSVYYSANEYGEIKQVHFAFPVFDVTYKDDEQTILDQFTLKGFSTYHALTNATFDEQTQTLQSNSSWRGLGDASSTGQWVFDKGQFILKSYDIDPTYDGEINQFRIYGDTQANNN